MSEQKTYAVGIDVGSTTVKVCVLNEQQEPIFQRYQRHFANIKETAVEMLKSVTKEYGNLRCHVGITGSGGLNLAKKMGINFVQEVIAVTTALKKNLPDADVAIELGGEDAKIIYLTGGVEQRMNGICAGGTGAFIDQMAALLQTDAQGLNEYAKDYQQLYPIAARCGVFAKSDIQPLINDGVAREDLAASIFQAVVNQTISGLACGRKIKGKVAFLGGPLTFLSELRAAFVRSLDLTPEETLFPQSAHLFAAYGTALANEDEHILSLEELIEDFENSGEFAMESNRLPELFTSEEEYAVFQKRQSQYSIKRESLQDYKGSCFLGIDAGSTTSKLVLLSEEGSLLYSFYDGNKGDPLETLKGAFREIKEINPNVHIAYSCSTGYGETLVKDAFRLDEGEVETIAHYYAAKYFEPQVDSLLDIGGQDMKYIRIEDNVIDNIVLNEACSAGCGSFIENFANSLGYSAEEFAKKAVYAEAPVDLGTRCTVFMNSNVKQAQKEGASVEDIAAGLAYSVIKNALFKVIKLTDAHALGEHIVVQGGTFYNDAVLRSLELITGREVIRPEIAGLMGAFGAALLAQERYAENCEKTQMLSIDDLLALTYKTQTANCNGCENHCRLTVNIFSNGDRHISGNRCENGLKGGKKQSGAPNVFTYKRQRIFDYEPLTKEEAYRGEIGLPRGLNMYEDYPFWAVFFRELGFRTVLSPFSSTELFQMGMDSIPSESECYPAKLVHGHIEWLIKEGVKTIFYPCVYYERQEEKDTQNHFNCPMVISYPENIKNNVDNLKSGDITYLNPFIAFTNEMVLENRLAQFMEETFEIEKTEIVDACRAGWHALMKCRRDIKKAGEDAYRWVKENHGHGFVLAGRPYHLDGEVNHGIPEMIESYGYAVLTEDSVAHLSKGKLKLRATNQWMYHNRLYRAADFVSRNPEFDLIQLNSFGCGLDAVTSDQVHDILKQNKKLYTLLKIDEVNNLGSARIRVRSLMAAIRMTGTEIKRFGDEAINYKRVEFTEKMKKQGYTLLCTDMAPFHFPFVRTALESAGHRVVLMKNEDANVKEMGLKYVNNDACYPAMIVTGQIIDAVLSGEYDTEHLAVLMVQTGGGCRASNYVGFIRKALKDTGYGHIPVISVNLNGMETNPGFQYTLPMAAKLVLGAIYGDILMKVVLRMRPYEKVPGTINALHAKWQKICNDHIAEPKIGVRKFYQNCKQMIREFDDVEIDRTRKKRKVGIVGEVLVKFMPLANNHLSDLLEAEGCEVTLPDLTEFIEYCITNAIYRKDFLGGPKRSAVLSKVASLLLHFIKRPIVKEFKFSKNFVPASNLEKIGHGAVGILQQGNQCGEGWFLAGEMVDLIENGVNNIVCVQPFGCLPNHIVGKGVFKKLKSMYPEANLVAIDYDPSASEVNQLNRIKLMLENAKRIENA